MIDLHSHTTASDGQHAPRELLERARGAGITTLAVTDHDTVSGLPEAEEAAARLGIRLVPGIELSTFVHGKEVHVLGHFIRRTEPAIESFSSRLREERRSRMQRMVEKMRGIGYPVRFEEVLAIAGDAHLGRPHLARALVERGWCAGVKEAFDRFLGDGKPAFVERFKLQGEEAVALIREAGGAATVAHPAVSKLDRYDLQALCAAGLAGLEVQHSDQDPGTRERLRVLALELGLVPTAGSDFHGEKVVPGRHLGTASMAPEDFEALAARATGRWVGAGG